jgi:hypothetical protein
MNSRLCCLLLAGCAVMTAYSQPAPEDRDPSRQVERDWVDNRWNRTDIGQFIASNLDLPNTRIAKGLSIKVGANDEGAIFFDTAQCALRATSVGNFLQFSPARFGVIQTPRIAGELAFVAPANPWIGTSDHRYTGLHLHGKRIVLEYSVERTRVLESPWLESSNGLKVFTRSFEVGPAQRELKFIIASGKDIAISSNGKGARASVNVGTKLLAMALLGGNAHFIADGESVIVSVPAHETAARFKIALWTGTESTSPKFDEFAKQPTAPEHLEDFIKAGPPHWSPELMTTGQRALDTDILAIDTLTIPYENPWRALMFLTGVDFTPDGAAYVCTLHGDVWRVTGIDDRLGGLRWKRFATGLFQPLGLKTRGGQVFVLGRDQITRLHDLNGDGEADFYENFCNLIQTAPGHNYVTCLEKDDAGRFYYVDPRGVHRISADGLRLETLATGFRNPNSLGVSPDGSIVTVAPQQGEWTPSSEICEIKLGGYYGHGGPKPTDQRPLGFDSPLCWIPHEVDNSSGSQLWVPRGNWGPLGGQMLHLLWGRCGMMLVLRDVVDGVSQGAVVPLPGRFLSGPHRGSFNPRDEQLYVAASTGWQTSAVKDGALHRVRRTSRSVYLPTAWHAHTNGLTLTFAEPLERSAAEDVGSYGLRQWNYRYAPQYGSKDWSVADSKKEGRDEVRVKSAHLLPDGKTVFLEIPSLHPVMQMEIQYSLNAADGKPLRSKLWLTLNALDAARL